MQHGKPSTIVPAQSQTAEFDLHYSCYKDIFLLRTPITICDCQAQVEIVSGSVILRVVSADLNLIIELPVTNFLQAVSPILYNHGVYHVDSIYCDQISLLFSINVHSASQLKQFLTNKEAVQKELALVFSTLCESQFPKAMQPKSHSETPSGPVEAIGVRIGSEVYLMSPTFSNTPEVVQVNLANYRSLSQTWQRSKMFGFDSSTFQKQTTVSGFDEEAELADLQVELKDVLNWFQLGVQLKIPTHYLLAIRQDYRTTQDCRLEMLIRWDQLEKPTWRKLFSALVNIGRKGLADSLARKYGLPQPFNYVRKISDNAQQKVVQTEETLSAITNELKKAKEVQVVTGQKMEKVVEEEVPVLKEKVKTLKGQIIILKTQLEHRNTELEMFNNKLILSAEDSELQFLVKDKSEQIKSLQDELNTKETELNETRKQLGEKETELTKMMKVLSAKSTRVQELEKKVERLKYSFHAQQEEMNKKLIEASAASDSHEAYLKEIQIQRDCAVNEASKKQKEILQLTKKIAEQEKKITKVQEELTSHQYNISEQQLLSAAKEDDERAYELRALNILVLQLRYELQRAENENDQNKLALESAQRSLQSHERMISTSTKMSPTSISESEKIQEESSVTTKKKRQPPPVKKKPSFLNKQTRLPSTMDSHLPQKDGSSTVNHKPGHPMYNQCVEKEIKERGEVQSVRDRSKNLFQKLDLLQYYPQKLSLHDARLIRKETLDSANCTDPAQLYIFVLQRLMSCDYRCRGKLMKEECHSQRKLFTHSHCGEDSDGFNAEDRSEIHPMDSLLALIHCADDFLRQDLMSRLVDCQLSIPLLLPDPFHEGTLTMCLWAMRTIIKEFKCNHQGIAEIHECPLISYPTPIVTFIRFGKQERSKSRIMNDVISDSNHDHFFNHDCEGGNSDRLLCDGLVEVCWYLPAGKPKDVFSDVTTFLNLHGNAVDHPKQIKFLSSVSFIIFALITEDDLRNDEKAVMEVLKKLSSAPGGVVLCTASKPSKFKHLTEHVPKLTCLKLVSKNDDEIKKEVREKIKKKVDKIPSGATKSLEKCIDVAANCSIVVDERREAIVQSQKEAQSLLDMLKRHDSRQQSAKETMLPLQGRHLWQKWAALDKEEHRQLNRGGMRIEEYGSRKQKDKYLIRKQQFKQVNENLSPLMNSFIKILLTTFGSSRNYFLQYLKLYLNSHSRQTISSRKHEYKAKRSKLLEFQRSWNPNKLAEQDCRKQMEQLQQEIIDASLGLEHLLRELGQVYETLRNTIHLQATSEQSKQLYASLPMAGAELLIDGYPLELMDGDAAHVPKQWVTAVLQEVSKKLGNPRVFVLSVLGLQSTGKSTLINTTFGLQFNVSAGRCTRGAFMQLLPISDELKHETNCDYILVVDTEGLRAPELDAQKTQKHDNELATFVIGIANETMINIYGETPGDMDDILQTAVHAFLRMKSVRLSPSCQFVHQNVGAVAASDKGGMGRSRFKDKLDKMTAEAAKEEECGGQFQYFSDVIRFNEEKDVHHFPGLWRGDPPMAPVNPGYSEKALSLRSHVVNKLKPTSCKHLSDIQIQIQDLWNALLHEKFVFSFKNTLEISVYNSLEAKYVQWSWSFRSSMLQF